MPTSTAVLRFRADLSALIEIGKGRLRVRLGGAAHDVYGLDFLLCASFIDAGAVIQTALNAAALGATFTIAADGPVLTIRASGALAASLAFEPSVRRDGEEQHVIHQMITAPGQGPATYEWRPAAWNDHDFSEYFGDYEVDALLDMGIKKMFAGWYGEHPGVGYISGYDSSNNPVRVFPLAPAWYTENGAPNPGFDDAYVAAWAPRVARLDTFYQYLGPSSFDYAPLEAPDVPVAADYLRWLGPMLSLSPGRPQKLVFCFDALPLIDTTRPNTMVVAGGSNGLIRGLFDAGAGVDGEAHPYPASSVSALLLDPRIGYIGTDTNDLPRRHSADFWKGGARNTILANNAPYSSTSEIARIIKMGFEVASILATWVRPTAETLMLMELSWDTDLIGEGLLADAGAEGPGEIGGRTCPGDGPVEGQGSVGASGSIAAQGSASGAIGALGGDLGTIAEALCGGGSGAIEALECEPEEPTTTAAPITTAPPTTTTTTTVITTPPPTTPPPTTPPPDTTAGTTLITDTTHHTTTGVTATTSPPHTVVASTLPPDTTDDTTAPGVTQVTFITALTTFIQ